MRVLVFRGGALGDLILTLPVLTSLRTRYPAADLRVFGVLPHARLSGRLANAVHDLHAQALTPLFTADREPEANLREVIAGADLVLSYLSDPAGIISSNLQHLGVRRLVLGPYRMNERGPHAIVQLAAPLALLGIPLSSPSPRIEIREAATDHPCIDLALHLGSGSSRKNWPWERWCQLVERLQAAGLACRVALVCGEADEGPTHAFLSVWQGANVEVWDRLPLLELAGRLAGSKAFFGHDSGVSHLAAAVGTPVLALFGPTNPCVWSPQGSRVQVALSPTGKIADLDVDTVMKTAQTVLCRAG